MVRVSPDDFMLPLDRMPFYKFVVKNFVENTILPMRLTRFREYELDFHTFDVKFSRALVCLCLNEENSSTRQQSKI